MAKEIVYTIQDIINAAEYHHLNLKKMRFFIGEDNQESKCFGVFYDEHTKNFIVYKNKANGERMIRYQGTNEAEACQIIWDKIEEEIKIRKKKIAWQEHSDKMNTDPEYRDNYAEKRNANDKPEALKSNNHSKSFIIEKLIIILFPLVLFFSVSFALNIALTGVRYLAHNIINNISTTSTLSPSPGYYSYNNLYFHFYNNRWYYWWNDAWNPYNYRVDDLSNFKYYGSSYSNNYEFDEFNYNSNNYNDYWDIYDDKNDDGYDDFWSDVWDSTWDNDDGSGLSFDWDYDWDTGWDSWDTDWDSDW